MRELTLESYLMTSVSMLGKVTELILKGKIAVATAVETFMLIVYRIINSILAPQRGILKY